MMTTTSAGSTMRLVVCQPLPPSAEEFIARYFYSHVLPLLTPLVLDSGHRVPSFRLGSLNLAVRFRSSGDDRPHYGVVLVHPALPRMMKLPAPATSIALEELVAGHLSALFPDDPVETCWSFCVSRQRRAA
jgi:polyphosphate kinase